MYKREFIKVAAEKAGMTQTDFEKAFGAMLEVIEENLSAGEKVQLTGFGTFKVSQRKARKGRNPSTGAEIQIPAKTVPQFSAGKRLKDAVDTSKPVVKATRKPAKVAAAKA